MNKRPVSYLQNDPRWKDKPYRVKGESSTVGSAGCGPTCAAMVIQTITGKTFTPEDACNWSIQHGYKALKQGTYVPCFRALYPCWMLQLQASSGVKVLPVMVWMTIAAQVGPHPAEPTVLLSPFTR